MPQGMIGNLRGGGILACWLAFVNNIDAQTHESLIIIPLPGAGPCRGDPPSPSSPDIDIINYYFHYPTIIAHSDLPYRRGPADEDKVRRRNHGPSTHLCSLVLSTPTRSNVRLQPNLNELELGSHTRRES